MQPVTIVTGAAGGIGRAVCTHLAARGHRLVLCDVGAALDGTGSDPSVVETFASELEAETVCDAGDVGDEATAERCIDLGLAAFGRLDGIVHLAGFRAERSVLRQSKDEVARNLRTHLEAPLHFLRAASRHWAKAKHGGSVVLATGSTAFFGAARQSARAAAQAGVIAAVRSAALELRRMEIRVNAVAPTARTRQTEDLPLFKGISDDSMSPAHVAPLVSFLLSDAADDISGEVLAIAGSRVFSLQSRETTGAFAMNGPFDEGELAKRWHEIVRS